jgi:hypothetical protein
LLQGVALYVERKETGPTIRQDPLFCCPWSLTPQTARFLEDTASTAMTSSDRKVEEKPEERSSAEDRASSSSGERDCAAQSMSREEKQDLFIKKLYLLSNQHINETPEERLTDPKSRSLTSVASPTPIYVEPSPSPRIYLRSFMTRLSDLSSACSGMDHLCTGKDIEYLTQEKRKTSMDNLCTGRYVESFMQEKRKKKTPLVPVPPDIPLEISLIPSRNVSRLEDDDGSLARQIAALNKTHELTPTRCHIGDVTPLHPIGADDAFKNSPQCVSELSYQMEITRIFPSDKGLGTDSTVGPDEMEF